MRKLLLSTAILVGAAVPALAQEQTTTIEDPALAQDPAMMQEQQVFREAPEALEMRASSLMGMNIYASEMAIEGTEFAGLQQDWENVGDIGDVILSRDGQVQAVIVDVGGFLGIGAREVAIQMDDLRFVSDSATAEDVDDFFIVVNATREQFENAPEYPGVPGVAGEMGAEVGAAAGAAAGAVAGAAGTVAEGVENTGEAVADATGDAVEATGEAIEGTGETLAQGAETAVTETEAVIDETAEAATGEAEVIETETVETEEGTVVTTTEGTEATGTEVAADEGMTEEAVTATEQTSAEAVATREPIVREGFAVAAPEELTADVLQGAGVYDPNDERIGEISELVLSEDGQVTEVVIDVGGFLGIGEKPVALPMDSIDILRAEGGEEIRIYVSQTQEELEALPTYERS